MAINIHPYPGIHKKVYNKTRIVRRFIWWKKLEGKLKILSTAYILQRCLKNQIGMETFNSVSQKCLDWYDVRFTYEPCTFLKCNCGNELITSGSFITESDNEVIYRCTDCKEFSIWDFGAPIPIQLKFDITAMTEFV